MSIRSGFYNSVAGDKRKYYNEDMSRLIHLLINDGVFQNFENQFIVHPGNGLEVIVSSGLGWFNNHWIYNDNSYVIKLGAAPIVAQYKRIDSIVIKMDDTLNVRDGTILCIQGTPSEVPSPPHLVDSEDVHYHKLADVLVGANVTSIIASNITNYVGTTTTPFITGILKTIDITTLIDQWHDQFERWNSTEQQAFLNWATNEQNAFIDWFNRMKDQLTEDAAGRLQTEVDDVRGQIHTNVIDPTLYVINPSATSHGITVTNNGDGTFTVTGTSDSDVGRDGWIAFNLVTWGGNAIIGDGVDKVRLCGTPSGLNGKARLQIADRNTSTNWYSDTGDGIIINTVDGKITLYTLQIGVQPNTTFSDVVFKPMLTTDLDATYNDYVPYSGDGRLNENVADIFNRTTKQYLIDLMFPVGSVYVTSNSEFNPNTEFGGTWEPIKDRFILAAGDTYKGGQVGGSATHTNTVEEMATHGHGIWDHRGSTNGFYLSLGMSNNFGATSPSGDAIYSVMTDEGNSKPYSIMNPYVVKYIWERIN